MLHNHDILVMDSQESIVAEVLGTQIKGEVDTLAELQPHPLAIRCGASGEIGVWGIRQQKC